MTRAQGKHREFSLNQSVATLIIQEPVKIVILRRNTLFSINMRCISSLISLLLGVNVPEA